MSKNILNTIIEHKLGEVAARKKRNEHCSTRGHAIV